jgi:4'-phosphopantetheinyl transferase
MKIEVAPTRHDDLNKVSVYQAELARIPAQWLESFYHSLSTEERSRANRFVKREDRVGHVITYGLLRLILSHHCQLQPKEIQIHRSAWGRPYITKRDIHFNLSHTKKLLVIAIAHHEIGIDIEYVDTKFALQEVIELVLTKAEQCALAHTPIDKQQEKFFEYWTAKEAVLKLMGTGFRRDPKTFQIIDGQVHLSGMDNQVRIVLTPLRLTKRHFTGYVAYTHRGSQVPIVYKVIHDSGTLEKVGCISEFVTSLGAEIMSA